jgi:hypothetical protein
MASLNAIVAGVSAPTPAGSSQTIAAKRLAQLQADPAWRGKYLAGDVEAKSEFDQLVHVIAAQEDNR